VPRAGCHIGVCQQRVELSKHVLPGQARSSFRSIAIAPNRARPRLVTWPMKQKPCRDGFVPLAYAEPDPADSVASPRSMRRTRAVLTGGGLSSADPARRQSARGRLHRLIPHNPLRLYPPRDLVREITNPSPCWRSRDKNSDSSTSTALAYGRPRLPANDPRLNRGTGRSDGRGGMRIPVGTTGMRSAKATLQDRSASPRLRTALCLTSQAWCGSWRVPNVASTQLRSGIPRIG